MERRIAQSSMSTYRNWSLRVLIALPKIEFHSWVFQSQHWNVFQSPVEECDEFPLGTLNVQLNTCSWSVHPKLNVVSNIIYVLKSLQWKCYSIIYINYIKFIGFNLMLFHFSTLGIHIWWQELVLLIVQILTDDLECKLTRRSWTLIASNCPMEI